MQSSKRRNFVARTAAVAASFALGLGTLACGGRQQSGSEVAKKIAAGALVIDVRTVGEFSGGHFQGARNIPVSELPDRMSELEQDRSRPLVLYCHSGARSGRAAAILRKAGFTDVTNAGGLRDMPGH